MVRRQLCYDLRFRLQTLAMQMQARAQCTNGWPPIRSRVSRLSTVQATEIAYNLDHG